MSTPADAIRVLHVDDEPDFADVTKAYLERQESQFTVETTTNPDEALHLLADKAFDCLVTDYDMPGQTGIQLLETVREEYPALPVILFTGKGSEAVASDAISSGVTDYLQKKDGTEQYELLATRITTAVGQYRAERELERQNDLFEKAQDIADVGAWEYDIESDRSPYFTEQVKRIHGLSPDETLSPDQSLAYYYEDDRDTVREAFAGAVEGGEPYELMVRLVADDGTLRWVRTSGEPQTEDGDVVRVRGTLQDITDLKQREQRLERQKEKIKALHAVAADMEACETVASVYELVVEAAESILEFDIAIADEAVDDVLVPKAVSSHLSDEQYYSETPVHTDDNLAARAYRTGDSIVVSDLRTHDVAPADSEFRSALTVPIGERGIFQAVSKTTDGFDDTDLELVELVASHADRALARLAGNDI